MAYAAMLQQVARVGGPKLLSAAGSRIRNKRWAARAAASALKGTGRPRPRRALTSWLRQPDTMRDILLASAAPGQNAVEELDRHLMAASRRWAKLPRIERHERLERVLTGIYTDIFFQARTATQGIAAATSRLSSQGQQTQEHVREVGRQVQSLQQSVDHRNRAATDAEVNDRLRELPRLMHDRVREAHTQHPELTWQLITSLTEPTPPLDVIAEWTQAPPQWLSDAPAPVLLAAAELAAAYDAPALAARLFLRAVEQGAPRRAYWRARAEWLRPERDTDAGLGIDPRRLAEPGSEPFTTALHNVADQRWGDLGATLEAWQPADGVEAAMRFALGRYLCYAATPAAMVGVAQVECALALSGELLDQQWIGGVALARADDLTRRAAVRPASSYADHREAQRLALAVRDDRRSWRGPSAGAAAVACRAALHAGDFGDVVRIGTTAAVGGEATDEEARDAQVRRYVLFAQAARGEISDLGGYDLSGFTDHDRATVEGFVASHLGGDAQSAWRRAVEAAADDTERVPALLRLARSGATDIPGLDQVAIDYPDFAAELRALVLRNAGQSAQAITELREVASRTVSGAFTLAELHAEAGDLDQAVDTLTAGAQRFREPDLAMVAVGLLTRAGRRDEARVLVRDTLAAASEHWPGRVGALQRAADLAIAAGDNSDAITLCETAIELDPGDHNTRWALIRLHLSQGDENEAWSHLQQHPGELHPRDESEARAELHLRLRHSTDSDTVAAAARIARRWAENEALVAAAATAALMSTRRSEQLPDDVRQARDHILTEFFARWPDSSHLRQMRGETPDEVMEALRATLETSDEVQRATRDIEIKAARSQLPYGMLSVAAHKPYATVIVRRAGGTIPAWHPDRSEHAHAVNDAAGALGRTTLLDSTAAAALTALPIPTGDALIGLFDSILVSRDAIADAREARDAHADHDRDTLGLDERTGQPRLSAISEEQAGFLAEQSQKLLLCLQRFTAVPVPPEPNGRTRSTPWLSTIDIARSGDLTVWADDAALRVAARSQGTAAASTAALLQVAADRGHISRQQHTDALLALRRAQFAGPPASVGELLELAEDDGWRAGAAAMQLSRPDVWLTPHSALQVFRRCMAQAAQHAPQSTPDWLYLAARGSSLAAATRDLATNTVGGLLAAAILDSGATGDTTQVLLDAARLALIQTSADPDARPDPLPGAAEVLLDVLSSAFGRATAAQFVLGTFASSPEAELSELRRRILLG